MPVAAAATVNPVVAAVPEVTPRMPFRLPRPRPSGTSGPSRTTRTGARRWTRLAIGLAAAATAVPLAACTPTNASFKGCAPMTKTLAGSVSGATGNFVNVMLGFDIQDGAHHAIGQNGCGGQRGYGATLHLNYCLPATGARSSQGVRVANVPACARTASTKNWSLRLPANAAYVYVEAYPKRTSSSPRFGTTDFSHYGMSYRRAVPVGAAMTSTKLVMPTVCHTGGPNMTGGITGRIFRGNTLWRAHGGTVNAWSIEAANSPVLGMGLGTVNPGQGTYSINFLTVMSRYTLIANVDGVSKQFLSGALPAVSPCAWTHYDLHF